MNSSIALITCSDDPAVGSSGLKKFFSQPSEAGFIHAESLTEQEYLDHLVYRISRKPKLLSAHIERIYFCFQHYLNEQLYAALVDLLVVLDKGGSAISRRMIDGAKSKLSPDLHQILQSYLDNDPPDVKLFTGNRYSIFTKGVSGVNQMIHLDESSGEAADDPLAAARNYVASDQPESARKLLERAVFERPDNLNLHRELLSLYQSTANARDFNRMFADLILSGTRFPDEWTQLSLYFKGLRSYER